MFASQSHPPSRITYSLAHFSAPKLNWLAAKKRFTPKKGPSAMRMWNARIFVQIFAATDMDARHIHTHTAYQYWINSFAWPPSPSPQPSCVVHLYRRWEMLALLCKVFVFNYGRASVRLTLRHSQVNTGHMYNFARVARARMAECPLVVLVTRERKHHNARSLVGQLCSGYLAHAFRRSFALLLSVLSAVARAIRLKSPPNPLCLEIITRVLAFGVIRAAIGSFFCFVWYHKSQYK